MNKRRASLIFLALSFMGCQSHRPAPPPSPPANLLPEISRFLTEHKEYGDAIGTEEVPDWAEGKRQRVVFDLNGKKRNLLFYTKENKVVTIYEDTSDGRKMVWGKGE